MKANPHHSLVNTAVLVFTCILILLILLLLLHSMVIGRALNERNADLQDSVEELQITTEELQITVDTLLVAAEDQAAIQQELINIDDDLSRVDEQLLDIEENIEDLALVPLGVVEETPQTFQNKIDRVLFIAALLISILSMATAAALLGVLFQNKEKRSAKFFAPQED